jgi:serine protease
VGPGPVEEAHMPFGTLMLGLSCMAGAAPLLPAFVQQPAGVTWRQLSEVTSEGRHRVVGSLGDLRFTAEVGAEVLVTVEDAHTLVDVEVVRRVSRVPSVWQVRSARGEGAFALAQRLGRVAGVTDVLPDLWLPHRRAGEPPDDPGYADQWYFQQLAMPDVWPLALGREEPTTVVVVDNGCDGAHPDLVNKLDEGLDVVDDDTLPEPAPGEQAGNHGTACAGIVGAQTRNTLGIAGACPHCRLRCVRLLSPSGMVPVSSDIRAFQFSQDVGAAVVSNSWGFTEAIPVPRQLAEVITQTRVQGNGGRGALVVFAMGNDAREVNANELQGVEGVLGVGAITRVGDLASFSNTGALVDVVVQAGTFTTDLSGPAGDSAGDYTSSFGGTSSACPVAAGVAALLFSARPGVTADEVEAALVDTARQSPYAMPDPVTGHDVNFGYGVVSPLRAWRQLDPEPPDAGMTMGGSSSSGSAGDGGSGDTPGCGCSGAAVPVLPSLAWLAWFRRRRMGRRAR